MISRVFAEKVLFDIAGMEVDNTPEGGLRFFALRRPGVSGMAEGFGPDGQAVALTVTFARTVAGRKLRKLLTAQEPGVVEQEFRDDEAFVAFARQLRACVDALPEKIEDGALNNEDDSEFDPTLEETEAEALRKERRGQDIYRRRLEGVWDGRCAVTGIAAKTVLRASHAKAWKDCRTGSERVSGFNGLLLCANLDALFDKHEITFSPGGDLLVSKTLSDEDKRLLGLDHPIRIALQPEHEPFMKWHREQFEAREKSA